MTGTLPPFPKYNLMVPRGLCLKERCLVVEVSSMPCAGIGEAKTTTMHGKPSGTLDGIGKDCCHIS